MFDVHIQIVNYNTKKYLEDLLFDLFKDLEEANFSWKVSVIDNASNDNLNQIQSKFGALLSGKLSVYNSEKNLGFGGGHNLLSQKERAQYLLLLNPDIRFTQEKTIQKALEKISTLKDENVCVLGAKLFNQDHSPQHYDHGEKDGFLANFFNNKGDSFWKNSDKNKYVAWVSGAFFLIEKAVFERISGFDENFFLYKEEEELCLRLRNLGYKIFYFPQIKVMHIGSVVAKKSEFLKKSRAYFKKKHKLGLINAIKKISF